MKRLLFLLLIGIVNVTCKSQIVFCPPGAEWHYLFSWMGTNPLPGSIFNETIKYVGDSIDCVDTLKILSHKRFFLHCSPPVTKTVIKQKGDTVFFKNSETQNTWQILYNFAALPGHSWVTTVSQSYSSPATFTFNVNSVQQVNVNGFNLKNLFVNVNASTNAIMGSIQITERYGSSGFLFNYEDGNASTCDAEYFNQRLCYQDSSFGIKQFSNKPCDYFVLDYVGINETRLNELSIGVFPNPFKDVISIKATSSSEFMIFELSSRLVFQNRLNAGLNEINTSGLKAGVYLIQVKNEENVWRGRFVKVE
jgi:hypothetical protein